MHDKNSQKNKNMENSLKLIKKSSGNPTVNVIPSGEKLDAFPLKSGTTQECSLSPTAFNIVLEALTRAVRQENAIKCNQLKRKT